MPIVFIGIGSNIKPEKNLRRAATLLREIWPHILFSSVFKTAPMEFTDQPAFLNAAARLETEEPPEDVLKKLQMIEHTLKKSPPFRFGPRTIDMDILLYDNNILPNIEKWKHFSSLPFRARGPSGPNGKSQVSCLVLPHVRMHHRRFVLEPLCELINQKALHPVFQISWKKLLQGTLNQGCEKTTIPLTHAASQPPQRRPRGGH